MKRSLAILAVTLFIDLLGFGLIIPLLPVYITHYGGAPWVGGVLLASFSTMQFIFSPIWGRVSDQRGRRPMILMSLIGSAISFLAFGFAPNLVILVCGPRGGGHLVGGQPAHRAGVHRGRDARPKTGPAAWPYWEPPSDWGSRSAR